MIKNKTRRAFTLVEILVVSVILALISLTIFATFSSAVTIWQRINRTVLAEDLVIFSAKMNKDFRNSVRFTTIEFQGDKEKVEFAALVKSPQLNVNTVGRIRYIYDPNGRTLSRLAYDYSGIFTGAQSAAAQSLREVKSAVFQYYFYDPTLKDYVWLEEWSGQGLPLAVKLEMEFDQTGFQGRIVQTFAMPVGGK